MSIINIKKGRCTLCGESFPLSFFVLSATCFDVAGVGDWLKRQPHSGHTRLISDIIDPHEGQATLEMEVLEIMPNIYPQSGHRSKLPSTNPPHLGHRINRVPSFFSSSLFSACLFGTEGFSTSNKAPHFIQNLSCSSTSAWHWGHSFFTSVFWPQWGQKTAESGIKLLQYRHLIIFSVLIFSQK